MSSLDVCQDGLMRFENDAVYRGTLGSGGVYATMWL
jgi:hypothetical protein